MHVIWKKQINYIYPNFEKKSCRKEVFRINRKIFIFFNLINFNMQIKNNRFRIFLHIYFYIGGSNKQINKSNKQSGIF